MSSTFSSFKNSIHNPFRDLSMEMVSKKKGEGNQDLDGGERRLGRNQGKQFMTNIERHSKHMLPENIKVHNVQQRQALIKKNSNHFVNSLAQPDYLNLAMSSALATGRSSDGGGSSNPQTHTVMDGPQQQYQSMVSAYGANRDQIKVLLQEITKFSHRKKQQSSLEARLYKKKSKKSSSRA